MCFEYVNTFTLIMEHLWLMGKSVICGLSGSWIKRVHFALCLWHEPIFLNFPKTIKSRRYFEPKKVFYTKKHMFCWIFWHVTTCDQLWNHIFNVWEDSEWILTCKMCPFYSTCTQSTYPTDFFSMNHQCSMISVKVLTFSKHIHGHFGSVRRQKTWKN